MENYSWNVSNLSPKRNGQSAYNINGKMILNILVLELKMYFTFDQRTLISHIVYMIVQNSPHLFTLYKNFLSNV